MKNERQKTLVTVSFKAKEPLAKALRAAAEDNDLTISQIVREGLRLWFAKKGKAA